MTATTLRRDVVIVACAVSAGIHVALAPEHFREHFAAGLGFVVSAVVLAAIAVVLTRRPDDRPTLLLATLTFVALLAAYALAVTTGVPLLHPDVDPVAPVALATKVVEAAGLLAALPLLRRERPANRFHSLHLKGTLT
jgi:drug/metabolite transporter (DMT)-like permease